jgi:hypothetical protein
MRTTDTPRPVDLDTLLTLDEAAALWRLSAKELSAKSKGRSAKIPGIWINARVVRFHPRMMFTKVARDNGVPMDVIMGALNVRPLDGVSIAGPQTSPP